MSFSRLFSKFLAGVVLAAALALQAWSQPGVVPDIQKPKKYENRTLASEKSDKGKFNPVKRAFQNTGTHYNYYFNGNNKINDIINRAKLSFKEDYTQLLPFYNYTLENTARQKNDLDSVIIKSNAAILLHDLRNDWIDNMYMLMGKAYFLKKNFDTARITFQYINYYFQPRTKEEIGYQKFVGSNLNNDEGVYSVATKENRNIVDKTFTLPPSRNEALLWLVRTYIEKNAMNEAAGLLETLKRDPYFPKRLNASLHEMQAYWYYNSEMWDSCVIHLEQSLDNAANAQEKARWEYLLGQLYEKTGKKSTAGEFYDKALTHTTDPVLEVFSRLAEIRLTTGNDQAKIIDENIKALIKMAKRAQYESYRDVIYYTAAEMELLRDSVNTAEGYLQKSVRYNLGNSAQRNKSLYLLGNIAYDKRHYLMSYSAYDSLNLSDPVLTGLTPGTSTIRARKDILREIVELYLVVTREDSLQKVAAMPEKERDEYVKAEVKRLKRAMGLKESEELNLNMDNPNLRNTQVIDLFATVDNKGDWYFYNTSIKAKGYLDFKNKWGSNRPNVDNWRRQADINAAVVVAAPEEQAQGLKKSEVSDVTFEGLMKNLPLTPEALQKSNDTIHSSLFSLGVIFMNKQEDYEKAVIAFEQLLQRFPNTPHLEEVVFDLYFCYTKLGKLDKAALYKDWLKRSFPSGRYLHYIDNPVASKEEQNKYTKDATKAYEQVYDLFIEGQFDSAFALKRKADEQFDETNWTPQLLYIESVYYIRQHKDSLALDKLRKITALHPTSPMIPKVKTMISVLSRRREIENYLTNLKVERAKEDSLGVVEETPKPLEPPVVEVRPSSLDSIKKVGVNPNQAAAPTIKDNKVVGKIDSAKIKMPAAKAPIAGYTLQLNASHYVVIMLDKVDQVFANEARNAFNRYNKEKYGSMSLEISPFNLDDTHKFILMNPFPDAISAMDYVDKTRKLAPLEIVPWLTTDKYSFMIISADNLETLKSTKDLEGYRKFLNGNFPGRF